MFTLPPDLRQLFNSQRIDESLRFLSSQVRVRPDVALILGSGLGDFAEAIPERTVIPASAIPFYPLSTVPGHKGQIAFGRQSGKNLLAFQGRVHLYECNDLSMVLHPVIVAAGLGAQILVVTNAAGGVNRQFVPGDLMLITDQIDLTLQRLPCGPSPHPSAGLYDKELIERAWEVALARGVNVRRGVYAAVKGPSYETAAEVEMVYRLGGDAVGMSTVKEVALAARLGMRVLGISCITNKAAGIGTGKLDHDGVTEVANRVRRDFSSLLDDLIELL